MIDNFDNIKLIKFNIFFSFKFNFVFRLSLLFIYAIYSGILLWKFSKKKNNHLHIPEKQLKITYIWLVSLISLVLFLVLNFIILTAYLIFYSSDQLRQNTLIINLSTGMSFVFLAIGVLFFPEILYGMPNHKSDIVKTKQKTNRKIKQSKSVDVVPIEIENDPFIELADKIKSYFEIEKPFINPNFSISDISLKMEVPQNHVSYCINSIFNTKFSKLKMELRIEYTKQLLQESKHSSITIDGIAQMSGFSSRSNFYSAFKVVTGETPSDYLNTIDNDVEVIN